MKRARNDEIRLLICNKTAGSIIGTGGCNITKLRNQHKALIVIPDSFGYERILTISSDLETVSRVLHDMIPYFEENAEKHASSEINLTMVMLVHQSQVGGIIGKGGMKIKEIREKTGAKIKIYSDCYRHSTDRPIIVQGNADTCMKCTRELMIIIKTLPLRGVRNPYIPE